MCKLSSEYYRILKSINYSVRASQIDSILNWIDLAEKSNERFQAKELKKLAYSKLIILTNTF
jgi:hypothetical protein